MSAEPILIPCEGSGQPGHYPDVTAMCKMCGRWHFVDAHDNLVPHDRPDIIAMIDRGDFDVKTRKGRR